MPNQPFPQIDQLGHVVKDVRAAMEYWIHVMKVGPFFFNENAPLLDFTYRGKRSQGRVSVASAYLGSLQIELIQTLDDEPSVFRDFLRSGYEGLQHVGYMTDNYAATLQDCQSTGMELVQDGESNLEPATRYCYLVPNAPIGSMVELIGLGPRKKKMFQAMSAAAKNWDGTQAIRPLPIV